MGRARVYIKPFTDEQVYETNWLEITKDVVGGSLGSIKKRLDLNAFDVGTLTNSEIGLSLTNNDGKYSDVGNATTIFKYKRSGSLVKITWDFAYQDFFAGTSEAGDILGGEVTIFEGLLNDLNTTLQVKNQLIKFTVQGYDSLFDRAITPDWTGSPPADNKASTLLKALIAEANAAATVPVLTIDNGLIVPGNDIVWDDITVFRNKKVRDAINVLLQGSNSVLYLNGSTPVVADRTPSTDVKYNFYGPASTLGSENILDIADIRTGLNRTFNFISWRSTTLTSINASSVAKYGALNKELDIEGVTNTTKRQSIIDEFKLEFGDPKQEMILSTPVNYDVLNLLVLDKVDIDYPIIPINEENLPFYDQAEYGSAIYPAVVTTFEILQSVKFKIIALDLDIKNEIMKLTLREV